MRWPSPQQGPLCPLGPWMAAKRQPSPAAPCLTRSTAWTLQNCTKQGTGEGGRQRAGEAQRGDVVPGDELGGPPPPAPQAAPSGPPRPEPQLSAQCPAALPSPAVSWRQPFWHRTSTGCREQSRKPERARARRGGFAWCGPVTAGSKLGVRGAAERAEPVGTSGGGAPPLLGHVPSGSRAPRRHPDGALPAAGREPSRLKAALTRGSPLGKGWLATCLDPKIS